MASTDPRGDALRPVAPPSPSPAAQQPPPPFMGIGDRPRPVAQPPQMPAQVPPQPPFMGTGDRPRTIVLPPAIPAVQQPPQARRPTPSPQMPRMDPPRPLPGQPFHANLMPAPNQNAYNRANPNARFNRPTSSILRPTPPQSFQRPQALRPRGDPFATLSQLLRRG